MTLWHTRRTRPLPRAGPQKDPTQFPGQNVNQVSGQNVNQVLAQILIQKMYDFCFKKSWVEKIKPARFLRQNKITSWAAVLSIRTIIQGPSGNICWPALSDFYNKILQILYKKTWHFLDKEPQVFYIKNLARNWFIFWAKLESCFGPKLDSSFGKKLWRYTLGCVWRSSGMSQCHLYFFCSQKVL